MTFTFGASAAKTSAPAFSTFGTTTSQPLSFGTQPTAFNFGSNPSTTTSAPTGSFGSTAGFSFGQPAATKSAFSFGQPASTASSFSFGQTPATTSSFSFGQTPATTSSFSFGQTPATTSSFSFGQGFQNTSTGSGFGLGTTQPSFGPAFTATTSNLSFGQPQPSSQDAELANLATALSMPSVYGDERDSILSKWNRIQAFWGSGVGYFSPSAPAINFTSDNPFCRFKAIGYSCIPKCKNEDGLVGLVFNKKESDIRSNQQQMVDNIHRILQSKPTLSICVEGLKGLADDRTEVIIFVMERAPSGASRRIPSTDFFTFANQPAQKTQFTSLGVVEIIPKAAPAADQLKLYLDSPPNGIDPLIWQQAKQDNPDPETLIPVPMVGFTELKRRLRCQAQETKLHQGRLDLIATDVAKLQKKYSTIISTLEERKRKQLELSHRVLKVMVRQEISRKLGFGIQNDEEQLRVQLEAIYAELSAPTHFKGRLSEIMSQIRMQSHEQGLVRGVGYCPLDSDLVDELKIHLKQQQENLLFLTNTIKNASEDLKIISDHISKQNV